MPPRLTAAARLLIDRQRGVMATWQLSQVGLSSKQARTALRGDWQRLTTRTLFTYHGEPGAEQLRMSGVLDGGPHAALTGCSALIESGWTGDADGHVDVVVPRGQWQADLERQNALVAGTAGALLLRITGWQVRHDPEPFFSLLGRVVSATV